LAIFIFAAIVAGTIFLASIVGSLSKTPKGTKYVYDVSYPGGHKKIKTGKRLSRREINSIINKERSRQIERRFRRKNREILEILKEIDSLTGKEFELFVSLMFKANGYKCKLTPDSHDFGADIIALKNDRKCVIQAKRSITPIGIKAVQEIIGAIKYYGAQQGYVVTNNYFSQSARELARANNILLLDRHYLLKYVEESLRR